MWQQLNANNPADPSQELQLMYSSNIKMKKNYDICCLNHCTVDGARWSVLSISKTADLLLITHNSLRQNGAQNKKHSVCRGYPG